MNALSNSIPSDIVVERKPTMVITPVQPMGPLAQAKMARDLGYGIAEMRELLALQKEFDADEARKAFVADMAAYKLNPPEILKDKIVTFVSEDGTKTYTQATLGAICEKVITTAAAHGFSHRWVPSTDGDLQVITCVITHRLGHSEETSLSGERDETVGMSALQGAQSTNSQLARHSLLMAFGFAPKEMPDAPDLHRDDAAPARAGATAGDPSENAMTKKWCDLAHGAKTTDALKAIRKDACADFLAAEDEGRWAFFRDWIDGLIVDASEVKR